MVFKVKSYKPLVKPSSHLEDLDIKGRMVLLYIETNKTEGCRMLRQRLERNKLNETPDSVKMQEISLLLEQNPSDTKTVVLVH
jgi:hypothetical protein